MREVGDSVPRIAQLSRNVIEFQLHDLCEVTQSDSVLRIARHIQLHCLCEVSE